MKPVILFLGQQSWRSGAERVLDEVLSALAGEFTPLVALPEDGPFADALLARGVETVFFPLGHYHPGRKSVGDITAFPYRSAHCALWLANVIRKRRVSLVYINGPRCLWAGALAARLAGLPSLFHLHMTMIRRTDRFVGGTGSRYVTRIVACSNSAANALLRGHPRLSSKLQVIYNPIRSFAPGSRLGWPGDVSLGAVDGSAQPIVGVVGRITRAKGQHVALAAIAQLVRRGFSLRLILLGAPDPHSAEDRLYLASLESAVQSLGLNGRVWLPGYQEDPGPYYRTFDALMIPTLASWAEGLPLVALEAMREGVPVIGSAVPGVQEIIQDGHNGLLAPPGDENALSITLKRLLTNPELQQRLRTGALATMDRRFFAATFHDAIRRVVRELCSPLTGSAYTKRSAHDLLAPFTKEVIEEPK